MGTARLKGNPVPHTETVNAIRVHFRDWVMSGVTPSEYPLSCCALPER